jgi:hypothetical protein
MTTLLEGLEETEQLVWWPVPAEGAAGRRCSRQCFLLEFEVGVEVELRRLDRFMP